MRILQYRHGKAGRARLLRVSQHTAHGHAVRVPLLDETSPSAQVLRQVEAAEETDDRPRAARRIGLAAAQRLEDRVSRVLFRPRDGEAAGIVLDLVEQLIGARRRRMRALEATFLRVSRRPEVSVGIADEAEPERVDAERLGAAEREAGLEDVADERALGELGAEDRLRSRNRKERSGRQQLEVAELVRGAEARSTFGGALRL